MSKTGSAEVLSPMACEALIEFDIAWGDPTQEPELRAHLVRVPVTEHPLLFRHLLRVECDARFARGMLPALEQYLATYPDHEASVRAHFEQFPADDALTLVADSGADAGSIPETIGRYEVIRKLDQGGMGIVYEAIDRALNRTVAVKRILGEERAGREGRRRFRTEAQAIAKLQHPHIVEIFEIGEHGGSPYFAMEFCRGGSLSARVRRAPLPPSDAARIVEQLAWAVQAAHQAGIIHRDLKPSNVLLVHSEVPLVAKITDFGVAKQLVVDQEDDTSTGAILGTPAYMAPEQAAGDKNVGEAADIYGLGAVLYECLTGRPPFQAATRAAVLLQVQTQEPVSPRRQNNQVPIDLETITLKCLHKEPSRRYATAAELAEDLRRYLAGEPIRARPIGMLERAWLWSRRRPAVAALLLIVSSLLLVLVVLLVERFSSVSAALAQTRIEVTAKEAALKTVQRSLALENYNRGVAHCDQGYLLEGVAALELAGDNARAAEDEDRLISVQLQRDAWRPYLWQAQSPQPALGSLAAASLDATGDCLLTLTEDGTASLLARGPDSWSRRPFVPDPGPVTAFAFDPTGTTIALLGQRRVWVYNSASATLRTSQTLAGSSRITVVALNATGDRLLTDADGFAAQLWDLATGKVIHQLPHEQRVLGAAFDAMTGNPQTVTAHHVLRWMLDPKPHGTPTTLAHHAVQAALSPDGSFLLTLDREDRLTLLALDGRDRRPVETRLRAGADLPVLAIANSGSVCFIGAADGAGGLRTLPIRQRPQAKPILLGLGRLIARSPKGTILAGVRPARGNENPTEVHLWDLEKGRSLGELHHPPGEITALAFDSSGPRLATGNKVGDVFVWDLASQRRTLTVQALEMVRHLAIDAKGRLCVATTTDVRFWDAATGKPIGKPLTHAPPARMVRFGSDAETFVSVHEGESVQVRDRATGAIQATPLAGPDGVTAVEFSPDGRLYLGDMGGILHRLEARTGQPLPRPQLSHGRSVQVVGLSPDGSVLVTAADRLVHRWDAADGRVLGEPLRHNAPVTAVAVSPDNRLLLTGEQDGSAWLWNLRTGARLGPYLSTDSWVRLVGFLPGNRPYTISDRQILQVWDVLPK